MSDDDKPAADEPDTANTTGGDPDIPADHPPTSGRRSEPSNGPTVVPQRVTGPCIYCGVRCDVTQYVACPDCLEDPEKFNEAFGRYRALTYWFKRFGVPTIH